MQVHFLIRPQLDSIPRAWTLRASRHHQQLLLPTEGAPVRQMVETHSAKLRVELTLSSSRFEDPEGGLMIACEYPRPGPAPEAPRPMGLDVHAFQLSSRQRCSIGCMAMTFLTQQAEVITARAAFPFFLLPLWENLRQRGILGTRQLPSRPELCRIRCQGVEDGDLSWGPPDSWLKDDFETPARRPSCEAR